jgi:dihydroxyacetone kinase DhaKLM complex PTS-EIIA-like component DhaM
MKARIVRLSLAIALVVSLAAAIVPTSVFAQTTWYVDDDNCPGPGDGSAGNPFCLIQDAIDAATDGDTIIIAAGTYSPSTNSETFEILIDKDLTVQGAGEGVTIVDAEDTGRVFRIYQCTVEMSGMTIQDGNT